MPDTKNCEICNGLGYREVLISQHDNVKETVSCASCNGSGFIHQMTAEEENDYWEDYW